MQATLKNEEICCTGKVSSLGENNDSDLFRKKVYQKLGTKTWKRKTEKEEGHMVNPNGSPVQVKFLNFTMQGRK